MWFFKDCTVFEITIYVAFFNYLISLKWLKIVKVVTFNTVANSQTYVHVFALSKALIWLL